MEEVWKEIPGFDRAYDASNLGRIRSLRKTTCIGYHLGCIGIIKRDLPPRILSPYLEKRGYLKVGLKNELKCISMHVHRIVLMTFKPNESKEKYHAAHLNGIKNDNRLQNLMWCSAKENNSHKKTHGTHQCGEKHGGSKLTSAEVKEIRRTPKGVSISKKFNISRSQVCSIRKRITWKHI